MQAQKKIPDSKFLCGVLALLASLPLFCGGFLETESAAYWICAAAEVKGWLQSGEFHMMSSQALCLQFAGAPSAISSTLWLLPVAALQLIGLSSGAAFRLFMLVCIILSVAGVHRFMGMLVEERRAQLLGEVLWVLCPYRVYYSYDSFSYDRFVLWTLVPYAAAGLYGLVQRRKEWGRYLLLLMGAAAGMLYADATAALVLIVIFAIMAVCGRCVRALVALLGSAVLFLPAGIPFLRYLLKGIFIEGYFTPDSIMTGGYTIGKLLSTFAYENGHPGLGLGAVCSAFFLTWLVWCGKGNRQKKGWVRAAVLMCSVSLLMSLQYFVWDYVMRIHESLQRGIALLEDTTLFVGIAAALLAMLGAHAAERAAGEEDIFISAIFPAGIAVLTAAAYIYLCNILI